MKCVKVIEALLGNKCSFFIQNVYDEIWHFKKKKGTGNYLIKDLISRRKLEVPGLLAAAGGLYADFKNATL